MKKRIIIGIIIAVVATLGVIIFYPKKSAPQATIKVTRGSIVEAVTVTGATKASSSVELSFETTGRVTNVYAKVADKVKAGQALVAIDKSSLLADLAQAQAGLDSAKARLDELKKGTRPEEIAISEASVANARVALTSSRLTLLDAINNAFTAADDAGRNKTDSVFKNPASSNPKLIFTSSNEQYAPDLEGKKVSMVQNLVSWRSHIDAITNQSDILAASDEAQTRLDEVKSFLNELSLALNTAIITFDVTQETIDAWKASTATARAGLNTATSSLSGAASGMRGTAAALSIEEGNLALKKAGSTAEQISAQAAVVAQAAANVDSVNVRLNKTVLRSPIDGVVTRQDAKLGQIVTVSTSGVSNSGLVSISSPNNLEIEANIPETQIGRILIGEDVDIAFDAFQGKGFKGKVIKINPAETIIDGVVNYKITIGFVKDEDVSLLKSGLTANLTIKIVTKNDILLLPQYAILQNDAGVFIRIPDGKGGTTDRPIVTGSRDQNGMVEIISGATEGEEVINVGFKS